MIQIIVLLVASLLHAMFRVFDVKETQLAPDSHRYLHMGRGGKGYKPFHRRWLLPFLLKDRVIAFQVLTWTCAILIPLAVYSFLYAAGLTPNQCLFGSLLVFGLPAISKLPFTYPVLVDAPSHLFAVLSAASFVADQNLLGLILIVVGGCIKESVPVFAILFQVPFGIQPLSLIGLLSPLYTTFFTEQSAKDIVEGEKVLDNPIKWSIMSHYGRWFSMEWMLLPWGVCILAFLNGWMLPWLFLVLAFSYGQILISCADTVRHYQAAYPLMIYATASIVPAQYYTLLLLVHLLNPWQRNMT